MTRHDSWPTASPCWADLGTPDVAASSAFYSELLGWTIGEPSPEFGGYVMAFRDEAPAAGIGPVQDGAPAAWTLYFSTPDIERDVAATVASGGAALSPVMQIGPLGSMVVLADPPGAAFGLWQPADFAGFAITGEAGGFAWCDLRSSDPDAARDFYGALLGWTFTPLEMAGPDYSTWGVPGDEAEFRGGLGGMMGNDGIPPHWLVYLTVDDADTAAETTTRLGGTVLAPPFDSPFGRMVPVSDPHGAALWLVQLPQAA
jgi:predicted enzyme related to lactoylglutathione lyase